MNNIIHWYNTNRKTIWKVIGIIAVIIIAIQVWIGLWRENQERRSSVLPQNNKPTQNTNSIILSEDKSVVTGEKMTNKQNSQLELLDTFIGFCNDGKLNEAYNLLSADCKKEMYPTENDFNARYYSKIFSGGRKTITTENWIKNTYKVKFIADALSSGVYNQNSAMQDYITVVQDETGKIALNINSYIGKVTPNIQKEAEDINIKILEIHKYMDFEKYLFEVTNKSPYVVLLNDADNVDAMYLQDKNGMKYNAYTNEIAESELLTQVGETKKVAIKYHNKYSSTREMRNVVFNKIIRNYTVYSHYQNQSYYTDYATIQIDI